MIFLHLKAHQLKKSNGYKRHDCEIMDDIQQLVRKKCISAQDAVLSIWQQGYGFSPWPVEYKKPLARPVAQGRSLGRFDPGPTEIGHRRLDRPGLLHPLRWSNPLKTNSLQLWKMKNKNIY